MAALSSWASQGLTKVGLTPARPSHAPPPSLEPITAVTLADLTLTEPVPRRATCAIVGYENGWQAYELLESGTALAIANVRRSLRVRQLFAFDAPDENGEPRATLAIVAGDGRELVLFSRA